MQYKAIISDIDGTLTVNIKNSTVRPLPSKKVSNAIAQAQKKVHFSLATSRSFPLSTYLMDYLHLSNPCIVQNGALIIDAKTKNVLWEKQISHKDLFTTIAYCQKKKVQFVIDEKDTAAIQYSDSYVPHDPIVVFISELTTEEVDAIMLDLGKISTIALHKVPSWTPTKWGINITHAEVSKQHAIVEVAKLLDIETHEIIGVGDGYNDFPLLMACGLKVAMGNAVPELKAIADYIAPSVEEDGVADVIEKFILK